MAKTDKVKERNYKIERALVKSRTACLHILAATSIVLSYRISYSFLSKHLDSEALIILLSDVFVVGVYIAIDWLLGVLLDLVSDDVINSKWKEYERPKKKLLRFILTASIVLLTITGTMSLWTSGEITNWAIEKPQPESYLKLAEKEEDSYSMSLSSIEQDLLIARSSQKKRIRDAKSLGSKGVKDAIKSGSYWQKKAWQHERNWLKSLEVSAAERKKKYKSKRLKNKILNVDYRDRILKSIADSAALVKIESEKVNNLEKVKLNFITDGSLRKDTTISDITATLSSTVKTYEKRFSNFQSIIIVIEISMALLVLVLTYLIGAWRDVYSRQVMESHIDLVDVIIDFFSAVVNVVIKIFSAILSPILKATNLDVATSSGVLLKRDKSRQGARRRATDSSRKKDANDNHQKEEGEGVKSDNSSGGRVRYIDLKNDIDRAAKRWNRAMKKGDIEKARQVEETDFAILAEKGFPAKIDRENNKVSFR